MHAIICLGDSITQAAGCAENRRWTSRLAGRLDAWRPGIFTVHNRGVGGDTSARLLDRLGGEILPLLPGTVLIECGINDAYVFTWRRSPRTGLGEFAANLRELVAVCRRQGGWPVLLANHRLETGSTHQQGDGVPLHLRMEAYDAAIRQAAVDTATPLIDMAASLAAAGLAPAAVLDADGVHLSPAGQEHYAAAVSAALRPLLEPAAGTAAPR